MSAWQSFTEIWEIGQISPITVSDALLLARISETVAWCEAVADPADLRTPASAKFALDVDVDVDVDVEDGTLCSVGRSRSLELQRTRTAVSYLQPAKAPGRFMLYFPDANLSDGYAKLVSKGFFDVQNVPPPFTWVSFFHDDRAPGHWLWKSLLCYVPMSAIALAAEGIDGNPEGCIVWLDDLHWQLRERVTALVANSRR